MRRWALILAAVGLLLVGCAPEDRNILIEGDFTEHGGDQEQPGDTDDPGDTPGQDDPPGPEDPPGPDNPPDNPPQADPTWQDYIDYIFDPAAIAEVHLYFQLDEWNALLAAYDAESHTKEYVTCDVTYKKGTETTVIANSGVRLKGNTSRRRPEVGSGGHVSPGTSWNHIHFGLNFPKYFKDDAHTLKGVKKLYLKWFKDDPAYVREIFCYDMMRRAGIWTAVYNTYIRLYVKVEGDPSETYFGVYELLEHIDKQYIKGRPGFLTEDGNLWKCRYPSGLNSYDDGLFCIDDNSPYPTPYELKTNTKNGRDAAFIQIKDFIAKVSGKTGDSFYQWIQQVTDVDLLLKTYAANVVLGMWDDYWANSNNYYLYFTTSDRYDYKFFFIPYDYDNTLGTSNFFDAGRRDPLHWGNDDNPLIAKILGYPDFKAKYVGYLKEMVAERSGLFHYSAAVPRIRAWQESIRPYVNNDTGQDCSIDDRPASWGNQSDYRLLTDGTNNFFRVKTATIEAIQ